MTPGLRPATFWAVDETCVRRMPTLTGVVAMVLALPRPELPARVVSPGPQPARAVDGVAGIAAGADLDEGHPFGDVDAQGNSELTLVPSPSCPRSLSPQAHTEPLAKMATVWPFLAPLPPWNTCRTAAGQHDRTGTALSAVVPLPS